MVIGTAKVFEVDYMVYDELQPQAYGWQYLWLIESGGPLRVGFWVDYYASVALYSELLRIQMERPSTHRAMAQMLRALGGTLEYVEIDKVRPTEGTYEATLWMLQSGKSVSVGVRRRTASFSR